MPGNLKRRLRGALFPLQAAEPPCQKLPTKRDFKRREPELNFAKQGVGQASLIGEL